MSTPAPDDLARVTVISPTRRIDLALPGSATLGEILPNIIRFSGYEGGTPNEVVHNWVLQRVGEDPLDVTQPVSALDIRDGETLHLRQLDFAMPDAAFDDVVDAVATSAGRRPEWQPVHSVRMSLGVVTAFVLAAALALLGSHPTRPAALVVLGLAVAAAIAAALTSRAFGKTSVAAVLGWQSVALAALGGLQVLGPVDPALRVLVAAGLVLLFAGVAGLGAHVTPYGFLSVSLTALFVILAAMATVLLLPSRAVKGYPPLIVAVQVVAVAAVVILALTPLLPRLCYQLARIAMPNLPTSAEELARDNAPVQSDIMARSLVADRLLGALLTGTSAALVLAAVLLVASQTWRGDLLALAIGLALVLRSRAFRGLSQRLSQLVAGTVILAVTGPAMLLAVPGAGLTILVGAAAAVLLLVILCGYAASFTTRQLAPIWGRLADVAEWLALIALIPLVLWVLDLFTWALGLTA